MWYLWWKIYASKYCQRVTFSILYMYTNDKVHLIVLAFYLSIGCQINCIITPDIRRIFPTLLGELHTFDMKCIWTIIYTRKESAVWWRDFWIAIILNHLNYWQIIKYRVVNSFEWWENAKIQRNYIHISSMKGKHYMNIYSCKSFWLIENQRVHPWIVIAFDLLVHCNIRTERPVDSVFAFFVLLRTLKFHRTKQ